jgi:hypothetical protein
VVRGIQCIWGRGEAYVGFWWGNLRDSDHFEDPGVDRIILRRTYKSRSPMKGKQNSIAPHITSQPTIHSTALSQFQGF